MYIGTPLQPSSIVEWISGTDIIRARYRIYVKALRGRRGTGDRGIRKGTAAAAELLRARSRVRRGNKRARLN